MDSIQLSRIRAKPLSPPDGHDYTYQVDATLFLDLSEAGRFDDATATVDYVQVVNRIISLIEHDSTDLLEALTTRVADAILLSHQVRRTRVSVTRLGADDQTEADFQVTVTIERAAEGDDQATMASLVSAEEHEAVPVEPGYGEAHRMQARSASHPALGAALARHHDEARNRHYADEDHTRIGSGPDVDGADGRWTSEPQTDTSEAEGPVQIHQAVVAMECDDENSKQAMYVALASLDGVPGSQVVGISPLYASVHPGAGRGTSLCAVVLVQTPLGPRDLYRTLTMVESTCRGGDSGSEDSGPLALNVVDYEGMEVNEDGLRLPLAGASTRASILVPWAALDADAVLVGPDGGSVAELSRRAPDVGCLHLLSEDWILDGLS
ncbi:dihydroneopterin aldolase [Bifidobacterium sp. W8108]|uniref:dihydroneopterin aldolase n=1 Tax=unclassified Bifidobacterium TaxID=2608897 RepID=UPI0018DB8FDE|nr:MULTISPECIES: dihydroneopterin aldolase [unclassified Bifidobacterium]MBH9978459.1 dihydroneopterin aldolase [Bifidobacterium sp. W8108]MBI0173671.1 dihydroneopterin aldolase [Bifidobacterium sp. M0307]